MPAALERLCTQSAMPDAVHAMARVGSRELQDNADDSNQHLRPDEASVSSPSSVVMTPFCVAGGISNCSSGTVTVAVLDLTTCQ